MTIRKCHIRLNKLERNRNRLLECLYYINNQMHSKKQKEIEGLQDTEMEMESNVSERKKVEQSIQKDRRKDKEKKLIRGSSPHGCIVMLREKERERKRERERERPPAKFKVLASSL